MFFPLQTFVHLMKVPYFFIKKEVSISSSTYDRHLNIKNIKRPYGLNIDFIFREQVQ